MSHGLAVRFRLGVKRRIAGAAARPRRLHVLFIFDLDNEASVESGLRSCQPKSEPAFRGICGVGTPPPDANAPPADSDCRPEPPTWPAIAPP
jgi:hypothetical protein